MGVTKKHSLKFSIRYERYSCLNHEKGRFCDLLLRAVDADQSQLISRLIGNDLVGLVSSHSL